MGALSTMFKALLGRGKATGLAHPASPPERLAQAEADFRAGRHDAARAACTALLEVPAQADEALNLLAAVELASGQVAQACEHYDALLERQPADARFVANAAEAWRRGGEMQRALDAALRAITLDPGRAGPHFVAAQACDTLARPMEAVAHFRRHIELKPDAASAHSGLLSLLMRLPVDDGELAAEHLRWGRMHADPLAGDLPPPAAPAPAPAGRRLKLGYVSADFCHHAVGEFIEPVLEAHDRGRFELHAFSSGAVEDDLTARLRAQCTSWHDLRGMDDARAAQVMRDAGMDLLVDLSGHTRGNRLLAFARRPAPLQLTWMGYLGSTGMAAMDCRITDAVSDPPGSTEFLHSERLLRLPHAAWCYRAPAREQGTTAAPRAAGPLVFGSFNSFFKLNDAVLDNWAALLRALPDTRLRVLGVPGDAQRDWLLARLAAGGVDASRIDVVGRLAYLPYLAAQASCDIALDPYPQGGATTTCDSLWMGLPVVTRAGRRSASRASASILSTIGLGDLVAGSDQDYRDIAACLARDAPGLARLRAGLRGRMLATPLMQPQVFVRNLEALYERAWAERGAA
jgi:protein O-GlcNAc transferase